MLRPAIWLWSRAVIATVPLAILSTSCATKEYVETMRYVVDPVVSVQPAQPTDASLAMRPLEAASPYKMPIVYLESDHVMGEYDHAVWSEFPRDVVTRTIMHAIRETGAFHDVASAFDVSAPDYILTGSLLRFEEDRTTIPATAVCKIRLDLRETVKRNALWSREFVAAESLADGSHAALAKAMSRAVASMAEQVARDVVAALHPNAQSGTE